MSFAVVSQGENQLLRQSLRNAQRAAAPAAAAQALRSATARFARMGDDDLSATLYEATLGWMAPAGSFPLRYQRILLDTDAHRAASVSLDEAIALATAALDETLDDPADRNHYKRDDA